MTLCRNPASKTMKPYWRRWSGAMRPPPSSRCGRCWRLRWRRCRRSDDGAVAPAGWLYPATVNGDCRCHGVAGWWWPGNGAVAAVYAGSGGAVLCARGGAVSQTGAGRGDSLAVASVHFLADLCGLPVGGVAGDLAGTAVDSARTGVGLSVSGGVALRCLLFHRVHCHGAGQCAGSGMQCCGLQCVRHDAHPFPVDVDGVRQR